MPSMMNKFDEDVENLREEIVIFYIISKNVGGECELKLLRN